MRSGHAVDPGSMLRVKTTDLWQTLAMVTDAFRVCGGLHEELAVGCTGFSWGVAISACATVVSECHVACVQCCGSVVPDVLVAAFMKWQHDIVPLRRTLGSVRSALY